MDDAAHRELAEAARRLKGKLAISGYRCDLMDTLYTNWRRYEAPAKNCHSSKTIRREALWTNY
jgi:DNA adenine methylase